MKKVPNLKRVKITSELELKTWLAKNPDQTDSILLVTHSNEAHPKFVSREQVSQTANTYGWTTGFKYTLNPTLLGHVIKRPVS